jgi:hypothetical protein
VKSLGERASAPESWLVRTAAREDTLSLPPVRLRADGEVALAGLLRIGPGLGTGVARGHDELVKDLLRGAVYSLALLLALMLALVCLGALR